MTIDIPTLELIALILIWHVGKWLVPGLLLRGMAANIKKQMGGLLNGRDRDKDKT